MTLINIGSIFNMRHPAVNRVTSSVNPAHTALRSQLSNYNINNMFIKKRARWKPDTLDTEHLRLRKAGTLIGKMTYERNFFEITYQIDKDSVAHIADQLSKHMAHRVSKQLAIYM